MKHPLLLAILLLSSLQVLSQSIDNVVVFATEEGIEISFDIQQKQSLQELYNVQIYSSVDNYKTPLTFLKGKTKDVGTTDRLKYVLDGQNLFAGYKGEVDFKIVATMIYAPILVTNPYGGDKYKKGHLVEISWKGGVEGDTYTLDLYEGKNKVKTIGENIELHQYSWIAKDTKKGNYKLKISSVSNTWNMAFSPEIKIKSKVPVIIKLLPLFAAAAGGYFYWDSQQKKDVPVVTVTDNNLPEPPKPPTGRR